MSEAIGLIPAAGQAKRISPLPCSKELYPVGFWRYPDEKEGRPKVVCHYLLEKMRAAGIVKAYIVLRQGKWDIPAYLQDGAIAGMQVAYLIMNRPFGVPYTLDQAYPFVQDEFIAFGFPDILFQPDEAFSRLLSHQESSQADLTLGLFPAEHFYKVDMVDLDQEGRVQRIIIQPSHSSLRYTWGIAVWTPVFTQFLHDYVIARKVSAVAQPELSLGEVFQAAIDKNLRVVAEHVSEEPYLDIGTPDDLVRAVKRFGLK
jgi:glucose-1-phosphate thymidylyltransferase